MSRSRRRAHWARKRIAAVLFGLGALAVAFASPARAEMSKEELAKLSQNPVGNLVSVPFQNNTNFNYGPLEGTQNILNIQPVIPVTLNKDWNVITRTIFPLIWQPELVAGQAASFGARAPSSSYQPIPTVRLVTITGG